ncbi:MAG: hypothetical protein M3O15_07590 [Acidobacteriota bacterium]|nr:hypothetical protein [Acidobacteriota bacterium]
MSLDRSPHLVRAIQVEGEIQAAFDPVPYPGDERLLMQPEIHSLEGEEIQSAFSGRHWSEVAAETFVYHHQALFFLSPEAFQFFLPGYLIAGIRSPNISSVRLEVEQNQLVSGSA